MTRPTGPDPRGDDASLEFLVGRLLPSGEASRGGCPDAGLLAAAVEGRVEAGERAALEEHFAACEVCRSLVAALLRARRAAPEGRVVPLRRPGHLAAAAAAAALIVLAVGLGWLLRSPGTAERLQASARSLREGRPDLFAGFAPLDAAELADARPPVERAELTLFQPRGTVLSGRPVFRWGPRLSTKWEVSLLRPDRAVVWSVRTDGVELLFPAAEQELEPGARLLWRVVAVDLPGRPEARGGFAVATLEERRAFEAAREELGRLADRRVRLLLEAHLALRRGWASEAEAAARAFVAEHPDDPLGRQTLRHARALTGRSRPD